MKYLLARKIITWFASDLKWYLKFYNVRYSIWFYKNIIDQCIYLKVSEGKYILLTNGILSLLHDTEQFSSQNFEMKDMSKVSYVTDL